MLIPGSAAFRPHDPKGDPPAHPIANERVAEGDTLTAEEAIAAMTLQAPRDGILVVATQGREGRKYQVGDNVWVGLSVAQTLVRRHGGAIHVESTPGQGAAFTVRLPMTAPEES